jgi:hypothetical protein
VLPSLHSSLPFPPRSRNQPRTERRRRPLVLLLTIAFPLCRYEIRDVLGKGAYGTVHRAVTAGGNELAAKCISKKRLRRAGGLGPPGASRDGLRSLRCEPNTHTHANTLHCLRGMCMLCTLVLLRCGRMSFRVHV